MYHFLKTKQHEKDFLFSELVVDGIHGERTGLCAEHRG